MTAELSQTRQSRHAETAALSAENLSVRLGQHQALDDVSLRLHAGEWVAVVGPNGAGKSTLLSVLAGLRAPDSGRVLLQGQPLASLPARSRAQSVAWLSQQGEAEGDIAARDVVRLGRLPHHGLLGAPDAADEAAVEKALAQTEATAFAARRLSELSGGERQRVLLARALAVGAPVLLLDEPTTHLDAPHQSALVRSLKAQARAGTAVVSVLHDMNLALAADRILLMSHSRLAADGHPGDSALHHALQAAFEDAFSIEPLTTANGRRWLAVPAA